MAANLKIVIVGDGAVGKTSLLYVYTNGSFPEDYVPTVYDDYTKNETYQSQSVNLSLWDTAGQEEYANVRTLSYDDTDVYLLAYSCVQKESLQAIKAKWMPELQANSKSKKPVMILVGTKVDLRDSQPDSPDNVSDAAAEAIANEVGASAHITCSAKENIRVSDVFMKALEVHFQLSAPKKEKGCCTIL
ncbi:Rac3a, Rho family GTPase [Monocercomonoides exilis]|uniref:Rac3a, Rho family GTPase n=1 Tax=Monocercomonoides exilis TaxID=2049356 RepID=UPI00355A01C0|nr:Rac3a, Rho family GTPase [Monocercomonoides exilis]|eukprot:MONOS_6806.1-p1 / transcript=MONOS_6806.1 / gene=MONOS_6806 / organism=Monocercomonoides_exilis_PA203 / gene_product=Rac3a, Rho family GTPase / transcript_product=Rac3a, Rho family GTPase / location=Mono_scaffold00221:73756-74704(-) / protein_length=189 / sequence_SO=supercontig / SO=protein_coding / is_pseudo=false